MLFDIINLELRKVRISLFNLIIIQDNDYYIYFIIVSYFVIFLSFLINIKYKIFHIIKKRLLIYLILYNGLNSILFDF